MAGDAAPAESNGPTLAQPPPPGIFVPVPTFFARKKATTYDPVKLPLDLEAQTGHAVYLAKAGIVGQVLLGSTGEAVYLRDRERFQVIFAVRQALDRAGFTNYPIIVGTATQNAEEAAEQLATAASAGAQWGLVLAPGYFAGNTPQEGLVRWFTAVADRSPIPILLYHYPLVSNNVPFHPDTHAALSKHANIVGCKLSHGDVSAHLRVANHPSIDHARFRCYTGLGQHLLPVLSIGFDGAIDGSAGFFPRTMVRMYDLFTTASSGKVGGGGEGGQDEMRRLQYKISCMEELVVKHGTVGIKEAISRLRGFGDVDGTRLPLWGGLGDGEWAKWGETVMAMQEEERRLGGVEPGNEKEVVVPLDDMPW